MPVAVVRQLSPASPGTQDYTSTGLGTVKAVIALATYGAVDGTTTDHLGLSIGFTDLTTQNVICVRDQDGVGDSNCLEGYDTTALVLLPSTSAASAELSADYQQLVTDGVRLDFT